MCESERRRVIGILAVVVALIVTYWVCWYADRSLVASNNHAAYYQFENAFPLADGWLMVACIASIVTLHRRSPTALLWLIAAGGAGIYLFAMDSLYDLEHGIWWRSGAGGVIELVINVLTLTVSVSLTRWAWSRRRALSPTDS